MMRLIRATFLFFILTGLLAGGGVAAAGAQEPTFTAQTGHSTPVMGVAFSRDGRYMVTGAFNGDFKLWEAATRRELRAFGQSMSSVMSLTTSVEISPDGKTVALAVMGKISLWETATGREIRSIATGVEGYTVLWDDEGRLFVRNRKQVALYDLSRGRLVARLERGSDTFAVAPDGSRVAVGKRVEIWDVASNTTTALRSPRGGLFSALAFSHDGRNLLTGSDSGKVTVYDAATGAELSVFAEGRPRKPRQVSDEFPGLLASVPESSVKALTFSARGDMLATIAADGEIDVRKWPTGEEVLRVKSDAMLEAKMFLSFILPESIMRFTPDGEYIAACLGGNVVKFFSLRGKQDAPVPERESRSLGMSSAPMMKFLGPGRLYALPGGSAVHFGAGGRWLSVLGATPFLMSLASGEVTPGVRQAGQMLVKLSPDEATGVTLSADNRIRLLNFDSEESTPLGVVPAESLLSDISLDGRHLLSASFSGGEVRLWDLPARKASYEWRLPTDEIPILGNIHNPVLLSPDAKTFVSQSMVGVVTLRDARSGKVVNSIKGHAGPDTGTMTGAFSPDSRVLALSSRGAPVRLWEVGTGREIKKLGAATGSTRSVVCLTYSPDGKFLYALDLLFRVRAWEVETGKEVLALSILADEHGARPTQEAPYGEGMPLGMSLSPDGNVLAANLYRGDSTEVVFIDLPRARRLCHAYVKVNGDWLVKTPDGRFDTNRLENSDLLFGVFPDEPERTLSLDVFLRDYFEPRLLPRLLSGERLRTVRDIASLNRVQPRVSPPRVTPRADDSGAEVTVEVRNVTGTVQKDERGRLLESGVFDVRLFRDGQLVGHSVPDERIPAASRDTGRVEDLTMWREASRVRLDGDKALVTFRVKLPPGPAGRKVEFSAYAFNSDRVKSETARSEYVIRRGGAVPPRRAYVVAVGVNKYQNPAWNLRFAAADARLTLRLFSEKLRALNQFSEVVEIPLISDGEASAPGGATKANVRGVFDLLAGRKSTPDALTALGPVASRIKPANPDDLILISFSSHGYRDAEGIFYLLPYDIGEGVSGQVTPEILSRSISSDELSLWLDGIDAGEMVLIVDACHAAAAVENKRFKPAPMGSGGLARLAYDKGIRILSATQAVSVAVETGGAIGQGLLTYAMMREGLEQNAADFKPRDKEVRLKEWLQYGVRRVPKLYEDLSAGRLRGVGGSRDVSVDTGDGGRASLQQPALFDFTRRPTELTLSRAP